MRDWEISLLKLQFSPSSYDVYALVANFVLPRTFLNHPKPIEFVTWVA
jgi:hypothetical protein